VGESRPEPSSDVLTNEVCRNATGGPSAAASASGARETVLGFQAWLEILGGIGMLTFAVASRGRSFARASGGRGLMAGLISVAGYLAFLGAVTVLPLAPVAALRETIAIFGALVGAVVFGEEFGLLRMSAASLAAAGIVALARSTA